MTPKTIDQARHSDLISFLEKRDGHTFIPRYGGYRCRQHPSLAVKNDRLSWYWHSRGVGGFGCIDFLMKTEDYHFKQAVEAILGGQVQAAPALTMEQSQEKKLMLPERGSPSQNRLRSYLCNERGIDSAIIDTLLQQGKIYEDKRGNVVFVGRDERGQPRFASLRSTRDTYRIDCSGSDKRYGFCMAAAAGTSDRLYVFESAIDAMSHANIDNILAKDSAAWLRDNRLALSGTSDIALPKYLERHPTKELVLCLDNDKAGREAAVAIAHKYSALGYQVREQLPQRKDFNEDLIAYRARQQQRARAEHCI